jgi:Tol biopolymer transport system component
MTCKTLLLLAATALVALVAGCDGSQRRDGSQRGDGSSSPRAQQEDRGDGSEGTIVFQRFPLSGPPPYEELYIIDEDGTNETRLTANPAGDEHPLWSPDGQKIAFESLRDGPIDIYVMNADGTNEARLADDPATRYGPAWSPDGEQVAFLRSPTESPGSGADDIYVMDSDGTNERRLTQTDSDPETRISLGSPVWSPDGEKLAFSSSAIRVTPASSASPGSAGAATAPAEGMTGIYVINVDGTGLYKLTSTAAAPTWSPDGNKIAFYEKSAIYLINPDGTGRKKLTGDIPDPTYPVWSPDGKRIAFVKLSNLYVINADATGLRRLANATESVEVPEIPAWSPDGEKLAFSCPAASGRKGTDLCAMKFDGTELKRLALEATPEGFPVGVSWGRG